MEIHMDFYMDFHMDFYMDFCSRAKERVNGHNINKNKNAKFRELIKGLYSTIEIYKCKLVDEFNKFKRIKVKFAN